MDPSIIASLALPETDAKLFQDFWALAILLSLQVLFGAMGLRRVLQHARSNAEQRAGRRIFMNISFGFILMWTMFVIPNLLAVLAQQVQYDSQAKAAAKINKNISEPEQITTLAASSENKKSTEPALASPISSGKIQGREQTAEEARRSNNALAILVMIRTFFLAGAFAIPAWIELERKRRPKLAAVLKQ